MVIIIVYGRGSLFPFERQAFYMSYSKYFLDSGAIFRVDDSARLFYGLLFGIWYIMGI